MTTMTQNAPQVKAARKSAVKPARSLSYYPTAEGRGVLTLTVGKETTAYKVELLDADFGTAYRLTKFEAGRLLPNGDTYDVRLETNGTHSCECKGHLRWGHRTRCRHVAALLVLTGRGTLPPVPSPTQAEVESAVNAEADGDFAIH